MADTNDGNVNIGVNLDTDKVAKSVDGLKGKLTKLTGSNILKSVTGLGAAFLTVNTAIKAANKVIKETTEAYRVQAKAEKQLEAAAKNNPYLDGASVKALKNYAGELQKIGTIGDEQIIPFMAQLASAGRTQEEIQKILSAALDVSASGMMSLDAAVTQLNASYSGNVGMLGRQISELKGLTAEELKNGAAVDIVAQKFAGMSKEVTEATGTSEQLKNAWGDLKEEIGAPFEKGLKPMRKFFTELISNWADAKKAKREYEEATAKENKDSNDLNFLIGEEEKKQKAAQNQVKEYIALLSDKNKLEKQAAENLVDVDTYTAGIKQQLIAQQNIYESETNLINAYKDELKLAEDKEAAAKKEAATVAERNRLLAEEKEKQQNKADYIKANQDALNLEIEKIEQEAKARGEAADKMAIYNAYVQSYVDLVTGSDLVDENDPFSKYRLEELQKYAAGIKGLTIDTSELVEEIKNYLNAETNNDKLSDTIQNHIELLAQQRNALNETSDAWKEYNDKIAELERLKKEVVKQEEEETKAAALETAESLVNNINKYVGQFADIVSQVTQIATKNNEAETENALTDLAEQYNNGLISYEQYCDKKGEISKKAQEEQYKIELWAWNASLLQAASNIASGVASCLAEVGVPTALKYVNMGLIAASGAAQVAAIMQNKPKRPNFYTGGYIGGMNGASYGADNTVINARQGELVVNAKQQAELWKVLNGGGAAGGVALNVDVINNMGGQAEVNTQLTADGLRVTIDKIVKAGLAEGRYNASLAAAENHKTGALYL